jgi:hypothetical protein
MVLVLVHGNAEEAGERDLGDVGRVFVIWGKTGSRSHHIFCNQLKGWKKRGQLLLLAGPLEYIQCCSSGGQNKRDVLCSQNRYRTGLGGKEREWERKMERERERERERKTMK